MVQEQAAPDAMSLFAPEMAGNPYPFYAQLRRDNPVSRKSAPRRAIFALAASGSAGHLSHAKVVLPHVRASRNGGETR